MTDHRHDVHLERLQPVEDRGHGLVGGRRGSSPSSPRPVAARSRVSGHHAGVSPPAASGALGRIWRRPRRHRVGRVVESRRARRKEPEAVPPLQPRVRWQPVNRPQPVRGSSDSRNRVPARPWPGGRGTGHPARPPRSTSPARCPRAPRGPAATNGPGSALAAAISSARIPANARFRMTAASRRPVSPSRSGTCAKTAARSGGPATTWTSPASQPRPRGSPHPRRPTSWPASRAAWASGTSGRTCPSAGLDRNAIRIRGLYAAATARDDQSRSRVRSAALTRSSRPAPTDGSWRARREASRASPCE